MPVGAGTQQRARPGLCRYAGRRRNPNQRRITPRIRDPNTRRLMVPHDRPPRRPVRWSNARNHRLDRPSKACLLRARNEGVVLARGLDRGAGVVSRSTSINRGAWYRRRAPMPRLWPVGVVSQWGSGGPGAPAGPQRHGTYVRRWWCADQSTAPTPAVSGRWHGATNTGGWGPRESPVIAAICTDPGQRRAPIGVGRPTRWTAGPWHGYELGPG